MILKVYLGYDHREPEAYRVAKESLLKHASIPVDVIPLNITRLAECGLLRRPTDDRFQKYDILSNAAASTEFAISRFLVPMLAQSGWALFADCDMVFMGDVAELLQAADQSCAVQVVKHKEGLHTQDKKMDGVPQSQYSRKNWSSVILWNCDHPANKRLSLVDVQERKGLDLHRFYWLADSEIGDLPAEWNWLVNVEDKPANPKLAHFTLGGPWFPDWDGAPHDDIWRNYAA